MTGANRILIGLGWSVIALFAVYRTVRGSDEAVVLRGQTSHEVALGVPGYLQRRSRGRRIAAVLLMFTYSAFVILIAVKPFAKGLEVLGPRLGVSSFFMIQWVAPMASESPEFIATAYLVNKARTTAAFNALISSKLNQWTLLIGTVVVVYSISLGFYDALSFSQRQAGEIWLTVAQSFFAVTLLVNFEISVREALALLELFLAQFYPPFHEYEGLLLYSALYVVLGAVVLIARRNHLGRILQVTREVASPTAPPPAEGD
jgi:cation:H+ antiporter